VTTLILRTREELVRRNYSAGTIRTYLRVLDEFRRYTGKRLDHLRPDDIRHYQVHLLEDRKLTPQTVVNCIAALRFFYLKVLKRHDMKEDLPYPKHRRRLPNVLSPDEVAQLINAAQGLYHRALLETLYATGLRRSELVHLKVAHINSQRMVVPVEHGKGDIDREVPLSPKLLLTLRAYWRTINSQFMQSPVLTNREPTSGLSVTHSLCHAWAYRSKGGIVPLEVPVRRRGSSHSFCGRFVNFGESQPSARQAR
jgi:site-specific recombinase XerD